MARFYRNLNWKIKNDKYNKNFIFSISKYEKINVPYESLGSNHHKSQLIDNILSYNKISYIVTTDKYNNYQIYLSHSGKDILINYLFQFLFPSIPY